MRRFGIEELTVGEPLGVGELGVRYAAQLRSKSGKALVAEWIEDGGLIAELTSVAELSAPVRHPFLLREWGVLRAEHGAWRVSEHIEGAALSELMRDAPIEQPVACEIARKVARALHAAFDRKPRMGEPYGLIHARLGPADVLLGIGGQVKLGGVGRIPSEVSAVERAVVPTPYMAPELLDGRACHASDVYALGAMLAQMLTGRVPAFASPQADWHDAVSTAVSDRVRETTGQDALAELISWCLTFTPDGRPAALEVENWLDRVRGRMGSVRMAEWCQDHIPLLRDRGREEAQVAAGRVTLPMPGASAPSSAPVSDLPEPAPSAEPPAVASASDEPPGAADLPPLADVEPPTEEAELDYVEQPTIQVTKDLPPTPDFADHYAEAATAEAVSSSQEGGGPAEEEPSVPIIHDQAEHSTSTEEDSSEVRLAAIDFIAPSVVADQATDEASDNDDAGDTSFDDPSEDDATDRNEVEAPATQEASRADSLDEALGGREWPRPMRVPSDSSSVGMAEDRRNGSSSWSDDDEEEDVALPAWAWPVLLSVVAIGLVVLIWRPWDEALVEPVASGPAVEDVATAGADPAAEVDPTEEAAAPDEATVGDEEAVADAAGEDGSPPSEEGSTVAKPAASTASSSASSTSSTPVEAPVASKPAAEKPAASKPAAEKPAATKPAASKPAAEKPVATKPAAEKPVATKAAAEKPAASTAAAPAAYDPWADPNGAPASAAATAAAPASDGADLMAAAAAPATGTVTVKGDAFKVQFVGAGQTSGAGSLAPGTYKLMVVFAEGEAQVSAGNVTISAGASATVTCKASFRRCSSH